MIKLHPTERPQTVNTENMRCVRRRPTPHQSNLAYTSITPNKPFRRQAKTTVNMLNKRKETLEKSSDTMRSYRSLPRYQSSQGFRNSSDETFRNYVSAEGPTNPEWLNSNYTTHDNNLGSYIEQNKITYSITRHVSNGQVINSPTDCNIRYVPNVTEALIDSGMVLSSRMGDQQKTEPEKPNGTLIKPDDNCPNQTDFKNIESPDLEDSIKNIVRTMIMGMIQNSMEEPETSSKYNDIIKENKHEPSMRDSVNIKKTEDMNCMNQQREIDNQQSSGNKSPGFPNKTSSDVDNRVEQALRKILHDALVRKSSHLVNSTHEIRELVNNELNQVADKILKDDKNKEHEVESNDINKIEPKTVSPSSFSMKSKKMQTQVGNKLSAVTIKAGKSPEKIRPSEQKPPALDISSSATISDTISLINKSMDGSAELSLRQKKSIQTLKHRAFKTRQLQKKYLKELQLEKSSNELRQTVAAITDHSRNQEKIMILFIALIVAGSVIAMISVTGRNKHPYYPPPRTKPQTQYNVGDGLWKSLDWVNSFRPRQNNDNEESLPTLKTMKRLKKELQNAPREAMKVLGKYGNRVRNRLIEKLQDKEFDEDYFEDNENRIKQPPDHYSSTFRDQRKNPKK